MTAAQLSRLLEAERALEAQATRDPEAKSAVAHIAAWRDRLCDAIEAVIAGGEAPALGDADALNAVDHPAHLSASWEQVNGSWAGSCDRLLGLSRRLEDDDLDRAPGWYSAATLLEAVLRNSVTHPAAHLVHLYARPQTLEALQRQVEPRLRLLRELDAPGSAQAPAELNVAIHRALAGRRREAQSHLDAALRLRPELSAQARSESGL